MTLKTLSLTISNCERCPRLRLYCQGIARKRKKEFSDFPYWGRPVPGFGDEKAKLWILGLAPGAHGANRTGRMFTGDSSGDWLYGALFRQGLTNQATSKHLKDGLRLSQTFISAAARCAPPDNKPNPKELGNCRDYLHEEFNLLKNKKVILALGKIAFQTSLQLLSQQGHKIPKPAPQFKHGAIYSFGHLILVASYHPSRQNTNTGVLTLPMWDSIFTTVKTLIDD